MLNLSLLKFVGICGGVPTAGLTLTSTILGATIVAAGGVMLDLILLGTAGCITFAGALAGAFGLSLV